MILFHSFFLGGGDNFKVQIFSNGISSLILVLFSDITFYFSVRMREWKNLFTDVPVPKVGIMMFNVMVDFIKMNVKSSHLNR